MLNSNALATLRLARVDAQRNEALLRATLLNAEAEVLEGKARRARKAATVEVHVRQAIRLRNQARRVSK